VREGVPPQKLEKRVSTPEYVVAMRRTPAFEGGKGGETGGDLGKGLTGLAKPRKRHVGVHVLSQRGGTRWIGVEGARTGREFLTESRKKKDT